MPLNSKISYRLTGDYYTPVKKQTQAPARKQVANKVLQKPVASRAAQQGGIWNPMALPPVQQPNPAPRYQGWNPMPYNVPPVQAPAPAPRYAGWNPSAYNVPAPQASVAPARTIAPPPPSTFFDRLFRSNATLGGTGKQTQKPIWNPMPYNVTPAQAPAPAPRYQGWNPSPYNVQLAQQPAPAAPYTGWNPSPYNVPRSTAPAPNATVATPWKTSPTLQAPVKPYTRYETIQSQMQAQQYAAANAPQGSNRGQVRGGMPIVEDRFSRGNFLQGGDVTREPFAAYNAWNEKYNGRYSNMQMAGPYRNAQEVANSYAFKPIWNFDQTVIPMGLQPWISSLTPDYKDPWASDPFDPGGDPYMYDTYENSILAGNGGGWGGWGGYGGWGGGGGGGYGAPSGVNSYLPGTRAGYGARAGAPNYTGRGGGRASSYAGGATQDQAQWRMPMLVWNI